MGSTAASMSETELKDAVIDLAQRLRYLAHHDRPAQNRRGKWATHIQGNVGFVDLVLARNGFVLFIEFKDEKGKLDDEQIAWGRALGDQSVAQSRYHIWRPSDWLDGTIERVLKGSGPRTSAR